VLGATGTAGSRVTARLRSRDVTVVEVARSKGVDIISGDGLSHALHDADVVIDVSNPMPDDDYADITDTLVTAERNIVGACAAHGVQRLVALTMVGIDDPALDGLPYFAAKRAAKDIALHSTTPTTIVNSTHWHGFAVSPEAVACHDGEVFAQDWLIQPIAVGCVADVLVEAALAQSRAPRTIAGPQAIRLPRLTTLLLEAQGDGRRVRTVKPRETALSVGALLAPDNATVLGPDVDTWLRSVAPDAAPNPAYDDGLTGANRVP
jgi:uncharacterized protein YbjT (DUF2867 family)